MRLDKFDINVLEQSGDAQSILYEMYGKEIGSNNAVKQLAGIRTHLNYKKSASDDRPIGEMEETVFKEDGSLVTKRDLILSETESQDPTFVMKAMGYDPLQWKLNWLKTKRGYWDVSMKLRTRGEDDESGKPTYQEIPTKKTNHTYRCEISISPIQNILTESMVKEIFDELTHSEICPETIHTRKMSGKLLEVQIVDPHLGLLAWKAETEDADYDLKNVERDIKYATNSIVSRVKQLDLKIEQIVLPIGQDYFHFDTTISTTTKGTVMDTDSRWQKMYQTGVRILVESVQALRQIAPVKCMYVASNHDKMLSYCATLFIGAYFRNCKDVEVDISPAPRKYIRYGKCLVGLGHGAEEGKRINNVMQVERKEDWGETIYHEWHLAHFHSKKSEEIGGVNVIYLPPIAPRSSWEKEKGYVGSLRTATAFVWDKNLGKILTIDVNITV